MSGSPAVRSDLRLRLEGLGCSYGGRVVLRDVDLHPRPGSVTLVLGRNGAGKTTLMRRICGLTPGPGHVTFGSRPLLEHARPHEVLGVDLGSVQMHPGRSVRDHLRLVGHGVPGAAERVAGLAGLLGIDAYADRRPDALSTGMRRAVALVAALACDPAVLLLDEPLNGLEVEKARIVRGVIREHARLGGTVLLSSHILAGAELLADRLVLLEDGRVGADATVEEFVSSRSVGGVEVEADDLDSLLAALERRGVPARREGDALLVDCEDPRTVASVASEIGVLVLRLGRRRPTLEDALLGPLDPATPATPAASVSSVTIGRER